MSGLENLEADGDVMGGGEVGEFVCGAGKLDVWEGIRAEKPRFKVNLFLRTKINSTSTKSGTQAEPPAYFTIPLEVSYPSPPNNPNLSPTRPNIVGFCSHCEAQRDDDDWRTLDRWRYRESHCVGRAAQDVSEGGVGA